jgi:aminoglycoside/choline kinase family phosphotransferase
VRAASADASFRRYFRVDASGTSLIIMDAPPDKENSQPFVEIAALMHAAGLLAPKVLAWDAAQGFMLLDDLGQDTMMQALNQGHTQHNAAHVKCICKHAQYMPLHINMYVYI